MVDHLKVVELCPDPTVNDIPGQLRSLADAIERGEYPDSNSCVCVMSNSEEHFPFVLHWGDNNGPNHPVVQLALAQTFLLTRVTSR